MVKKKSIMAAKKAKNRKAIVKAAIEIFAQKGFHNAKITDIAKSANLADGTIYLYFENKDDLLIQSFLESVEDKLLQIQTKIELEKTAIEKLYKFLDYHIEVFTTNPYVVKFIVKELRQSPEFYEKYPSFAPLKNYLKFLKDICLEAMEEGSIRKVNPDSLSRLIFGTIDFVLMEWSLGNEEISLKDTTREIIDILHNGLKTDKVRYMYE